MWWKLGALAAVTIAVLFLLLVPTATMTIKVDLPPSPQHVSAGQVQSVAQTTVWITEAVLIAIVLAVAGFVAWRIIRRHQNSK